MTVAIDSSVLLAIFKAEPTGSAWLKFLSELGIGGQLVACDIVWAEIAPAFADLASLQAAMSALGVQFTPISEQAAFQAGCLFAEYRRMGGPRHRIIPDFMVAAHALVQADGLATNDEGYSRGYLSQLRIFKP